LPGRLEELGMSMKAAPFGLEDLPEDLKGMWIAVDGRLRLEIRPVEDLNDKGNLREFIRDVTSVAPDATGFPVHMTEGGKAVVASFREAFALSAIFISMFLLVMMPSVKHALLAMLPLAVSALFTGAIMDVVHLPLNFANIIGLPLILGIGVDNGIHMVYHFAITSKEMGSPSFMITNRGIIFSGLTTVCSFGNLAVSPHDGMAGMGAILAIGVVCTLFVTLLVLPALFNIIYKK
jgi:predicted RND superfamily exporter protein